MADEARDRVSWQPPYQGLDPSTRTVEQLYREIAGLKELMSAEISAIREKQEGFEHRITSVPTEVMKAVAASEAVTKEHFRVHEERFASVQGQFQASKDAVAAALQAQKEAVAEQNRAAATAIAKSETATTKQLEAQNVQMATSNAATESKVADLKDRLTRMEGTGQGISTSWAVIVALVGFLSTAIAIYVALKP